MPTAEFLLFSNTVKNQFTDSRRYNWARAERFARRRISPILLKTYYYVRAKRLVGAHYDIRTMTETAGLDGGIRTKLLVRSYIYIYIGTLAVQRFTSDRSLVHASVSMTVLSFPLKLSATAEPHSSTRKTAGTKPAAVVTAVEDFMTEEKYALDHTRERKTL